jgi:hypothetical protein
MMIGVIKAYPPFVRARVLDNKHCCARALLVAVHACVCVTQLIYCQLSFLVTLSVHPDPSFACAKRRRRRQDAPR